MYEIWQSVSFRILEKLSYKMPDLANRADAPTSIVRWSIVATAKIQGDFYKQYCVACLINSK